MLSFLFLSASVYAISADDWLTKGKSFSVIAYNEYMIGNVKTLKQKTDQYGVDFRYEVNRTPVMMAAKLGSQKIMDDLIKSGAKSQLTDNHGRTAMHLIILSRFLENNTKNEMMEKFYPVLRNDSLCLMINKKLIKLEYYQGEYL